MAPPKKPYSELSESAKFYRNNPKAKRKKALVDKAINKRPEQRAKRSELAVRNKKYDRQNGAASRRGKDWDHAVRRYVSVKTNRGRKGEGGR